MTVRLFLSFALALMLTSCASLMKPQVVFVPPVVNCGIFESPKVESPLAPRLGEKDVVVWQFYAIGWQALAEHLFSQRVDSARCVAKLRAEGMVK